MAREYCSNSASISDPKPQGHELIIDFRLRNGLCHGCGARIYRVSEGRISPLTIEKVALEGRCLFCYPDDGVEKDEPGDDRKRASANEGNSSLPKRSRLIAPQRSSAPEEPDEVPSNRNPTVKEEPREESQTRSATSVARLPPSDNATKEEANEKEGACLDDEIEEDENNSYAGRPKDVHISIRDFEGFVYFGTILEGNKQKGRGVFRYVHKNGDWKGKVAVYEGEFENGRMEGHGTSTDASGCVYTGSFHRGAAHGFGTCIWSENWRYEGEVRPKMRNSEFMRAITDSLL